MILPEARSSFFYLFFKGKFVCFCLAQRSLYYHCSMLKTHILMPQIQLHIRMNSLCVKKSLKGTYYAFAKSLMSPERTVYVTF